MTSRGGPGGGHGSDHDAEPESASAIEDDIDSQLEQVAGGAVSGENGIT